MKGLRLFWLCRFGAGLAVISAIGSVTSAQYRVEAVPGTPFGVGKVEVRLPEGQYSPVLGVEGRIPANREQLHIMGRSSGRHGK